MIIGIAGGSGAGKTTVASSIAERLGKENVAYVSQDWYFQDQLHLTLEERGKLNMDHPNAFDSQLLIAHLNQLRQGLPIGTPTFNFSTYTRNPNTGLCRPNSALTIFGALDYN